MKNIPNINSEYHHVYVVDDINNNSGDELHIYIEQAPDSLMFKQRIEIYDAYSEVWDKTEKTGKIIADFPEQNLVKLCYTDREGLGEYMFFSTTEKRLLQANDAYFFRFDAGDASWTTLEKGKDKQTHFLDRMTKLANIMLSAYTNKAIKFAFEIPKAFKPQQAIYSNTQDNMSLFVYLGIGGTMPMMRLVADELPLDFQIGVDVRGFGKQIDYNGYICCYGLTETQKKAMIKAFDTF